MVKQLSDKQKQELQYLTDWCFTVIKFMTQKFGATPGVNMYNEVLNDTSKKQNLKGLKYVYKDINEWAKGLQHSYFNELNILLQNKFGEDLVKVNNKSLEKVNKVVKKGKIDNGNEYELLLSRVEEIFQDESKKNELEELNKLLREYHKKHY